MSPILGVVASSNQQGRSVVAGSFDALATITLTSTASTIIFTGIPNNYRHLQLRWNAQTNRPTYGFDDLWVRYNNDGSSLYSMHYLFGNGSSIGASGESSTGQMNFINTAGTQTSGNWWAIAVADILDYSSTTKFKTTRLRNGLDFNGAAPGTLAGRVNISSGSYQSLNPINAITILSGSSSTFQVNTQFTLYGVK
jgi:hypothetical protein